MKKLIKVGLILTGALTLFLISGCSGEKGLDISNCIDDTVNGFNGKAKFDGKVDYNKLVQIPMFQNKLNEDMLSGDYKVKLVADKTTDLKNGDKIKLSLDYNKEIYKRDFGVELTFEPKEFEVKDLRTFVEKKDDLTVEQWKEVEGEAEKYIQESKILENNEKIKLNKIVICADKEILFDEINLYYKLNNSDKEYLKLEGAFTKYSWENDLINFFGISKVTAEKVDKEIEKGNKSEKVEQEIINYDQ